MDDHSEALYDMPGITSTQLVALHPQLYHMASAGSWPTIERHGLLSTTALLDLYAIPPADRAPLESAHRSELTELTHPSHGSAYLRDQKPMSDAGLLRALQDGLTPADWYRMLNARVFFWTRRERLDKLLAGRAYRDSVHTVLVLDTAELLAAHGSCVELSPINSGSTVYNPAPRGRDCFLPLDRFEFDHWAKKRSSKFKAIVELTVRHRVPDVRDLVIEVYETGPPKRTLFSR